MRGRNRTRAGFRQSRSGGPTAFPKGKAGRKRPPAPLRPAGLLCCALLCAALFFVPPPGSAPREAQAAPADAAEAREASAEGYAALPEGITVVGGEAFAGTGIRLISLPASLEYIADSAFSGSALAEAAAAAGTYAYQWAVDHGYLWPESPAEDFQFTAPSPQSAYCTATYKGTDTVVRVPSHAPNGKIVYRVTGMGQRVIEKLYLPDTVTVVDSNFLAGQKTLTYVRLSNALTEIPANAFRYCSALKEISIPSSVQKIGSNAFSESGITSLEIPEGVSRLMNSAFENMAYLETATLPESVTDYGEFLFSNCAVLRDVRFPAGKTRLEKGMFSRCGFTSYSVPGQITVIGDQVFYECGSLTSVYVPDGVTGIGEAVFSGCTSLSDVRLPSGLRSIGDSAFSRCSSLTSIDLPDGLTTIGRGAFGSCSALQTVQMPDTLLIIEQDAFSNCSRLSSVTIPDSVFTIGSGAFRYCQQLSGVRLSRSLTAIEPYTFAGCTSLRTIDLPRGITRLGSDDAESGSCFYSCQNLAAVGIPEGVLSIGKDCFKNSGITSIRIPSSVIWIGGSVFYSCKLQKVVFLNGDINPEQTSPVDGVFSGADMKEVTIHCPRDSAVAEFVERRRIRHVYLDEVITVSPLLSAEVTAVRQTSHTTADVTVRMTVSKPAVEDPDTAEFLKATNPYIYFDRPGGVEYGFDLTDGTHTAYMDSEGHFGAVLPELNDIYGSTTVTFSFSYRKIEDPERTFRKQIVMHYGCEEGYASGQRSFEIRFGGEYAMAFASADIAGKIDLGDTETAVRRLFTNSGYQLVTVCFSAGSQDVLRALESAREYGEYDELYVYILAHANEGPGHTPTGNLVMQSGEAADMLGYAQIIGAFEQTACGIIFIPDSCYSELLIDELAYFEGLRNRITILAASSRTETARASRPPLIGGFTDKIYPLFLRRLYIYASDDGNYDRDGKITLSAVQGSITVVTDSDGASAHPKYYGDAGQQVFFIHP